MPFCSSSNILLYFDVSFMARIIPRFRPSDTFAPAYACARKAHFSRTSNSRPCHKLRAVRRDHGQVAFRMLALTLVRPEATHPPFTANAKLSKTHRNLPSERIAVDECHRNVPVGERARPNALGIDVAFRCSLPTYIRLLLNPSVTYPVVTYRTVNHSTTALVIYVPPILSRSDFPASF